MTPKTEGASKRVLPRGCFVTMKRWSESDENEEDSSLHRLVYAESLEGHPLTLFCTRSTHTFMKSWWQSHPFAKPPHFGGGGGQTKECDGAFFGELKHNTTKTMEEFSVQSGKEIPPNGEKIAWLQGGEKSVESCHVSGCHGFFGPEIRVCAQESGLQAKIRSYRPKTRVADTQNPNRIAPTKRSPLPEWMGFRCLPSRENPPLKPSCIHLSDRTTAKRMSSVWATYREGANREKLTVKKLIDNEMFFFTVYVPYKPWKIGVNREKIGTKPWKNRHQKSTIFSPLVFHRLRLLELRPSCAKITLQWLHRICQHLGNLHCLFDDHCWSLAIDDAFTLVVDENQRSSCPIAKNHLEERYPKVSRTSEVCFFHLGDGKWQYAKYRHIQKRSSKWHYRQRKTLFDLSVHFIADTDTFWNTFFVADTDSCFFQIKGSRIGENHNFGHKFCLIAGTDTEKYYFRIISAMKLDKRKPGRVSKCSLSRETPQNSGFGAPIFLKDLSHKWQLGRTLQDTPVPFYPHFLVAKSRKAGYIFHSKRCHDKIRRFLGRACFKLQPEKTTYMICFLNEVPRKFMSATSKDVSGIDLPKIALHVFICDSENAEKLFWNLFSW